MLHEPSLLLALALLSAHLLLLGSPRPPRSSFPPCQKSISSHKRSDLYTSLLCRTTNLSVRFSEHVIRRHRQSMSFSCLYWFGHYDILAPRPHWCGCLF